KLREEQSSELDFFDDLDEADKITPAAKRKYEENSFKKNNKLEKHSKAVNEDYEASMPLMEEYLKLKESLIVLNSNKNKSSCGNYSFLKSNLNNSDGLLTSIPTSWSLSKKFENVSDHKLDYYLEKYHITIDGQNIPPPLKTFNLLKIPKHIKDWLKMKKILVPTIVQSVCLPIILTGRDVVVSSYTGSGKTLAFLLPMIIFAYQQEMKKPLKESEGPLFLIVSPSRELSEQTHSTIAEAFYYINSRSSRLNLRSCLAIGGLSISEQVSIIKEGIHIIVATPGRLSHLLQDHNILTLQFCHMICIDEADHLVDGFFTEEISKLLPQISSPCQNLLFSTVAINQLPPSVLKVLVNTPVVIDIAKSQTYSVQQDLYLVSPEKKLKALLSALQKTGPPVLVFAFLKEDVDIVAEYLLLKGISAVALHSDRSQHERLSALSSFKSGEKDILIATDIASKGLDFKDIKHVINFDLPEDIESYIHRIGRTGRHGKKGLATTLVDHDCSILTLIEIKKFLIMCNQPIPEFMENLTISSHQLK
ncbi:MAG: hypothetical protein MHPSP_001394, partial [Paramarteilia canceri]